MAEARTFLSTLVPIEKSNEAQKLLSAVDTSKVFTGVVMRALKTNEQNIFIGNVNVSATSFFLAPGESLGIDLIDLSGLYIYGSKINDIIVVFGLEP